MIGFIKKNKRGYGLFFYFGTYSIVILSDIRYSKSDKLCQKSFFKDAERLPSCIPYREATEVAEKVRGGFRSFPRLKPGVILMGRTWVIL